MPLNEDRTAADLAEWVRGVPILGWAVDSVAYAALLLTALVLVIVMAAFWYKPAGQSGWKMRLRTAIYTFLGAFLLLYVRRPGLIAEGKKGVTGGRISHTFDRAVSGSYDKKHSRGGGISQFIVGKGPEAEASRPPGDDDASSCSSSGSESSNGSDRSYEEGAPAQVGGTIVPRPEPKPGPAFHSGGRERGDRAVRSRDARPAVVAGVPLAVPPSQIAYAPAVSWAQPPVVGAYQPPAGGVYPLQAQAGIQPFPAPAPVVI
jgi:hypothetical protein